MTSSMSERTSKNGPERRDPWAEEDDIPIIIEDEMAVPAGEKPQESKAFESEPEKEPEPEPDYKHPLTALARKLGYPVADSPNAFFVDGIRDKDDEVFWRDLNNKAENLLRLMRTTDWDGAFSSDMQLEIGLARDWSKAQALLLPPIGEGQELTLGELLRQAENSGVRSGVDVDQLEKTLDEKCYFKVFQLAVGKAAVNGSDGRVEELYPREKRATLEADERSVVDFKNLNWLQCVNKGDVICNIIPPTEPEDGYDVGGNIIKGRPGREARLPRGTHIVLSEDGQHLVAETDGQLVYVGNVFKINPVVSIDGNVDSSVGNLDVVGSVNIKGSVLEGFVIRATGDIHIFGSVVGATVEAAGDIKINGGINGGNVSAGGRLLTKFIENTNAEVTGPITAENIINSVVACGEKVTAVTGKGAIIGGSITSFKGIEARVIGSERNLQTRMIVGCDPQLTKERLDLKAEVAELSKKAEEMGKNIRYLEAMKAADQSQQQLLSKLRLDFSVTNMNIAKKTARIETLEELLQGEGYQIVASHIYPPLVVTMGTITQHFLDESRMSRIYKAKGEIQLGMK